MNITSFTVNDASLPITMGMPLKKTLALTVTDNLTLRNSGGTVVPASFTVKSRWEALASNSSAPIKWILVDFIPNGTGEYTIDDSNGSGSPASMTVTDGASDIQVQTGNIDVKIPKTGTDLISQFKLSTVEQLGATKPQLMMPAPDEITSLVQRDGFNGGPYGGVGALAGQKNVIVANGSLFDVGQDVTFRMLAHFGYYTAGGIVMQELGAVFGEGDPVTAYNSADWIFARGTAREFILPETGYSYTFSNQFIGDMTPYLTELAALQAGDTIEYYQGTLEPVNTIDTINGNTLTLLNNLTYDVMQQSSAVAEPLSFDPTIFDVSDAEIEEQNDIRLIIKQTVSKASVSTFLVITFRYYFYAGKDFVRIRMTWNNSSDNPNSLAGDIPITGAMIRFPTSAAVTASDDVLLTLGDATTRVNTDLNSSTAIAGDFTVSIAEFAENFPSRLVAASGNIDYEFMPASLGSHTFFGDWVKTWEIYIGDAADSALALTNGLPIIYDAQYICDTKAVRHRMVPKKTWTENDFAKYTNKTELVEAANRAERLISCAYNINDCSSQGELGTVQRMTIKEWRLSASLYTGTNQYPQMIGWQYFGNTNDGGADGFTFNRYDVPFILLRNFLRDGNQNAYRFGNEHARYMAQCGTKHSKEALNASTVYFHKGLSRYERSPALTTGVQTPRPTHSWSEGIWLYWALTGDPIAHEAALLHLERARTWNYHGIFWEDGVTVDGSMVFNEARGPGWASLELLSGYRYHGDSSDLTLVKQYLDNLRLSEIDFGGNGIWVAPDYISGLSTGTQPFVWAGYPFHAISEYIHEKRFQGTPDFAMQDFAIRACKWLIYGSAALSSPGSNAPLVGGAMSGEDYQPYGSVYQWYPSGTTTTGQVALGDLCASTLAIGGFLSGNSDVVALANKQFRDMCFYRDIPGGLVDPVTRATINFRNAQYPSSTAKTWAQGASFIPDYLFFLVHTTDVVKTTSSFASAF